MAKQTPQQLEDAKELLKKEASVKRLVKGLLNLKTTIDLTETALFKANKEYIALRDEYNNKYNKHITF